MKFLLLALLAVGLIFCVKCVSIRSDLLAERQTIDADWDQVDAALTRRAAILPDLAALAQADVPAAARALTAARNSLVAAPARREKIQANAQVNEALARLMLQVDTIPKLADSKTYGDLLDALKGAEYQIDVARRKYNEAVEHYNAAIDLFPDNVVASVTGLGKIDAYFQTSAI